jgi:hypothetical protein
VLLDHSSTYLAERLRKHYTYSQDGPDHAMKAMQVFAFAAITVVVIIQTMPGSPRGPGKQQWLRAGSNILEPECQRVCP